MMPIDSTREARREWRFRAQNGGQDGKATAFVYCRKSGPRLTAGSAEATVADGAVASIEAQCAAGEEAVAGGFDLPDASTNLLASKRTGPGSWTVTLVNVSGASQTYKAFAYCDSSEPGLQARVKSTVTDPSERFSQSVTARCTPTQVLRSGGFEIERLIAPLPEDSKIGLVNASRRRNERGWKVTAFAALGDPQLTAYAYCA
jgi:hypothetical protein